MKQHNDTLSEIYHQFPIDFGLLTVQDGIIALIGVIIGSIIFFLFAVNFKDGRKNLLTTAAFALIATLVILSILSVYTEEQRNHDIHAVLSQELDNEFSFATGVDMDTWLAQVVGEEEGTAKIAVQETEMYSVIHTVEEQDGNLVIEVNSSGSALTEFAENKNLDAEKE